MTDEEPVASIIAREGAELLTFYPDGRVLMRGVPIDQLSREELIKGLKTAPRLLFPEAALAADRSEECR
jgi:hypothetical protein